MVGESSTNPTSATVISISRRSESSSHTIAGFFREVLVWISTGLLLDVVLSPCYPRFLSGSSPLLSMFWILVSDESWELPALEQRPDVSKTILFTLSTFTGLQGQFYNILEI